ncbi:MAG TPA: cyclic nucleotide-binding domain-containing protein [Candidatus Limnocylindrales bacterium]|jgi:CRP-like cAMP-binding protein
MPTDELTTILGATWFARDFTRDARDHLAALGSLTDIHEGTTIIREGDVCRSVGVVVDGRVALRLRLPGGDDRTILTVDPGDVFGWSAVLPPAIATASAVAIVPTRAVLFDGDALRAAFAGDCDLAAAVYQRLLAGVVRRLGATRTQLLDLYRAGTEPW